MVQRMWQACRATSPVPFKHLSPVIPAPVVKWKQFLGSFFCPRLYRTARDMNGSWLILNELSFWMSLNTHHFQDFSKHRRTRIMTRRVVRATSLRPTALSPGERQHSVWICMNQHWVLLLELRTKDFLLQSIPLFRFQFNWSCNEHF